MLVHFDTLTRSPRRVKRRACSSRHGTVVVGVLKAKGAAVANNCVSQFGLGELAGVS